MGEVLCLSVYIHIASGQPTGISGPCRKGTESLPAAGEGSMQPITLHQLSGEIHWHGRPPARTADTDHAKFILPLRKASFESAPCVLSSPW